MSRPFVSCICPTYNRRRFLPNLFYMFGYQTYPAELLELVVLDDSDTSNQDLVDALPEALRSRVRYVWKGERIPLGKKRNMLNAMAKGEYIVCMDDDDYYPPEKVAYTITRMQGARAIVSGSSEIYVYFTDNKKIYRYGPYSNCHATNGTLAYHRSYLKDHRYEEDATKAEEKHFMDGFTKPILQLDAFKTILCIAHGNNTVDKTTSREGPVTKVTSFGLKAFIKDKKLLDYFKNLV